MWNAESFRGFCFRLLCDRRDVRLPSAAGFFKAQISLTNSAVPLFLHLSLDLSICPLFCF